MLTSDDLEEAKAKGLLVPVRPIATWAAAPRAFLMCRPLRDALEEGKTDHDEKARQRWAQLEATMAHFVEGGRITQDTIKQLSPAKFEHWELISRKPSPAFRVFGRFRHPDVFVGTHAKLRRDLGRMWSMEFEHEKLVCEQNWKEACMLEPYTSPPEYKYENYITENASALIRIKK